MEEVFKKIAELWYLREPAYFSLYCIQQLEANDKMNCALRCGQGKLQYNPKLLERRPTAEVEVLMKIEMIRLFLKHPYERQPEGTSRTAMALGSDVCIKSAYNGPNATGYGTELKLPLLSPEFFKLPHDMPFEWYVRKIEEMLDEEEEGAGSEQSEQSDRSDRSRLRDRKNLSKEEQEMLDSAAARSELWEEDEMRALEINDIIDKMNAWGSIPGNMVQQIQASTKARIDYRKIMQGFRASILSNTMRLTRMRPNRRTGFQQMGSIRKFDTKLLVAVDVSGSISDSTLSHFYSVINKFFKYGINEIDCVQFDCQLGEVKPMRKASRTVEVFGRGGTSFQPVFDYLAEQNIYDGLIILTDGYAPHPNMDDSIVAKILWVCENEKSYNQCKDWMQLYGRVCWMYL
ncbi:MAG: hypothetical protein J5543_08125 [Bacteroidales bacterium]|nr:hypothetical protein [Bacteroidales bacterium]